MNNSTVTSNTNSGGFGGGIWSTTDWAFGSRSGKFRRAAPEIRLASLTLNNSQVISNVATFGGGIGSQDANLQANNSSLSYNTAGTGGGLVSFAAAVSVTASFQNCTVDHNAANLGSGGGGLTSAVRQRRDRQPHRLGDHGKQQCGHGH